MAITLQTRHILPMLKERGLRVGREGLAAMSDLLGLRTRPKVGNEVQRQWRPAEVELIAVAFALRRRWGLSEDDLRALVGDADGSYAEGLLAEFTELLAEFRRRLATTRQDTCRWEADAECTTAA